MVVAMSKGRNLDKVPVAICFPEFLREYGMGNVAVLACIPAAGDAMTDVSSCGQIVFKIAADALY